MRTLKVRWTCDEPEFHTFAEAVRASEQNPRYERAKRDRAFLRGRFVEGVWFNDETFTLYFAEGRVLRIFMTNTGVSWSVAEGQRSGDAGSEEDGEILIEFLPNGKRHLWRRAEIARGLVSRSLVGISASVAWFFMSVGDNRELMFARLLVPDTGKHLLYFGFAT
jgi:hypothetical protein